MEAFAQWKKAQLHLENAAQLFLEASIGLRDALSQHFIVSSRNPSFDNMIFKIQSQLILNDSIETKVLSSRAAVNSIRNMSTACVSLSILPSEILSRIFTLAIASTCYYTKHETPDPLLAISAVCTRWRQLAVGTRSLWSHIDLIAPHLVIGGSSDSTEIARLWLERSRGVPLHIHVRRRLDGSDSQLLTSLQPYLADLSSLILSGTNKPTFDTLLGFCSRHGVSGSLKSLVISGYEDYGFWDRRGWPTSYLRGLVELQLLSLPSSMTLALDELSIILSQSQTLQTLRIRKVSMTLVGQSSAVSLPALRLLDLIDLNPSSLLALLPILSSGGHELDFRLTLERLSNHDIVNVIAPFCSRTNVVSLYISDETEGLGAQLISLFSSTPAMRVLALDDKYGGFDAIGCIVDTRRSRTIYRCPKLHTLCLNCERGMRDEDTLRRVENSIGSCSFGAIIFQGCKLASSNTNPWYSDDEELWEFQNSLRRRAKKLTIDNGILDGDIETVDLYIRRLIMESK
ncbi:hypothetical protein FRC07_010391, partial [Ceratobasidium sp. 392]